MSGRTREDGRPDTGFMVDIVRDNTKFLAETRLGQQQLVASIGAVDGRLKSLEDLGRDTLTATERLVQLSEARHRREEAAHEAQLARDLASQEAMHRRTQAEIAESERRGAWIREKVGDKILIPLGTVVVSAVSGLVVWLLMRLGQPTQTVNVEAPQPVAVQASPPAPSPAPAPEPAPVPESDPVEPPPVRVRDDLMEFEP